MRASRISTCRHDLYISIGGHPGGGDARAAFPAALPAAALLCVWPLQSRPRNAGGRPAKLHAKFAVADCRIALLSSANLTADAFERNMEAGILVRGGPLPARLAEHLD